MRQPPAPSPPDLAGPHQPVMLAEVLEALAPLAGARFVDGTFGAGGYSRALLEAGASVVAIDRDPSVRPFATALAEAYPDRFTFVPGTFSALDRLVAAPADGVVLDIGVSSMQLDEPGRGFSFLREGPLDMRMAGEGESAADLVNGLSETELANVLFAYGEERRSRRIAHTIVAARAAAPIGTTAELARLIEKAIGRRPGDVHPATRSFQALRIAVNDELGELVEGLFAAERLLPEGGRLAVVSFHSLEDRIIKRFLEAEKTRPLQSRHLPQLAEEPPTWIEVRKPRKATPAEIARNPRSRSATLRSARRSAAPPRPVSTEGLGLPTWRGAA
ncbi:MAG TPA: 16S rRNA (cytosine(1402)-N(4))-methyltransferase RsmH [Devosiaceae bacterium]|nr:16S rRNA (cytosine(1402)-N(4))-methyltransferase RsmH [Devosiaceae bacterium]